MPVTPQTSCRSDLARLCFFASYIMDKIRSPSFKCTAALTRHLRVFGRRLEVIIFVVLVIFGGELLSGLGKVNLGTAGAATAINNVVQVNFLHAVLLLA